MCQKIKSIKDVNQAVKDAVFAIMKDQHHGIERKLESLKLFIDENLLNELVEYRECGIGISNSKTTRNILSWIRGAI